MESPNILSLTHVIRKKVLQRSALYKAPAQMGNQSELLNCNWEFCFWSWQSNWYWTYPPTLNKWKTRDSCSSTTTGSLALPLLKERDTWGQPHLHSTWEVSRPHSEEGRLQSSSLGVPRRQAVESLHCRRGRNWQGSCQRRQQKPNS